MFVPEPQCEMSKVITLTQSYDSDAAPPEVQQIRQRAHEKCSKIWDNGHLLLREQQFDNPPLTSSADIRVQEILDVIRRLDLPLQLYEGEGRGYYWTGADLENKEIFIMPLMKLRNETMGHEIQFHIEEIEDMEPQPHVAYGHIRVTMYVVDTHKQGSFYRCKQFIREQVGRLLLEEIGYNSLWGDATWSINSEIRGNPRKEDDFRWQYRFAGWDGTLMPIFINGLVMLYYRMGYVPDPYQLDAVFDGELNALEQRKVILLSEAAKERTREWVGNEAWFELTKYWTENQPQWRELQREREAQMTAEEMEEKKRLALEQIIYQRQVLDDLW
jgi:hypothetical protein